MSKPDSLQRVLLVDDDDFIQDVYIKKFEEEGLEVVTADNGEDGLEQLRQDTFDAVLIDMIMPGMDGMEFLETIRDEDLAKSASVIILSNQGQPDDIDAAKEFDIDGYIIKASNVPSKILEEIIDIYKETHA
jgi:CheY-like chemotaxis protein